MRKLEILWSKHGALLVGLTFFNVMSFLFTYTIFLGKVDWRSEVVHLPVRLSSAEGLRTGVPVFMHGVEVGSVGSLYYVTLDANNRPRPWRTEAGGAEATRSHGQTVIAILNMNRDLPYYPNYEVVTRYQTILSEKVVEVLPGNAVGEMPYGKTRPERYGPPGQAFPALNTMKFSTAELQRFHLSGELPADDRQMLVASNYDDPLYLIASVIVENRGPLKQITGNLRDITAKLNQGNRNIALLVNRAKLLNGANGFLRDVIVLTQEAREGLEDTRESRAVIEFLEAVLAVSGALI
ncbi:MAG: MlaD family protein [bacterium]|nr:MlaD family protein [bacterium]